MRDILDHTKQLRPWLIMFAAIWLGSCDAGLSGQNDAEFASDANRTSGSRFEVDGDAAKGGYDSGDGDESDRDFDFGDREDGGNGDDEDDKANGRDSGSGGEDSGDDLAGGKDVEEASECAYLTEDRCLRSVDGFPKDVDVCALARSGALEEDGNDLVGQKKVFLVDGEYYLDLDDTPRNSEFETELYDFHIEDWKDKQCEAYALFSETRENGPRPGCFLDNTMIRMADGSDKVARDIKRGDLVWNPVTKKPAEVTEIVKGDEKKPMYEIMTPSGVVTVTEAHPFATKEGMKQAAELRLSDRLLAKDGSYEKISRLKKLPADPKARVFNFTINGDSKDFDQHYVMAGGVISGDLYIQSTLEKAKMAEQPGGFFAKVWNWLRL